jgi:hypothetical protein
MLRISRVRRLKIEKLKIKKGRMEDGIRNTEDGEQGKGAIKYKGRK